MNPCSQSWLMASKASNQISSSGGSLACICCRQQAHHCRGELEVGVLLAVQVPCSAVKPSAEADAAYEGDPVQLHAHCSRCRSPAVQSAPTLKQMLPMKRILRGRMHPLLNRLAALGAFPASTAGLVPQLDAQSSQSSAVGTTLRLVLLPEVTARRGC